MIPSRRVREMQLLAFQRGFVWLALVVAVAPASLAQELPRASELTHEVLELRRAASIRIRGRLVYMDATKRQRVYQISILQKRLPQRTNLLWSVTDPPEARMRILIETPSDGMTTRLEVHCRPLRASSMEIRTEKTCAGRSSASGI